MELLVFCAQLLQSSTNLRNFRAQFILTFKATEKYLMYHHYLHNTKFWWHKLTSSECSCYCGVPGKRNASKFARFKFGWLQCVEHTVREGVQNTHHRSRRPQTSHQNQNRVGQAASCCHCCSCASVASTSFCFCQGRWWLLRALL